MHSTVVHDSHWCIWKTNINFSEKNCYLLGEGFPCRYAEYQAYLYAACSQVARRNFRFI